MILSYFNFYVPIRTANVGDQIDRFFRAFRYGI